MRGPHRPIARLYVSCRMPRKPVGSVALCSMVRSILLCCLHPARVLLPIPMPFLQGCVMFRKLIPLAVVAVSVGLSGCYDTFETPANAPQGRPNETRTASMARPAPMSASDGSGQSGESVQVRKIAESQNWVFEIPSKSLEAVWQAHRDICLKLAAQCEIVQASISSRGPGEGAQYASIEMRVDNAAFDSFLKSMHSQGPAPIETSINREDRTLQWVDLQSRLENAQSLRDRLQDMVGQADRTHDLSDLLAIERELNRVQSTIDSMQSQSRVLAQQTDKVRMSLNYRSAPQTLARDIWDPIRHAWHNMTNTFSQSVGDVMLFVAAAVPWLVVLIPGWIFGRWVLRKLFARWLKRP